MGCLPFFSVFPAWFFIMRLVDCPIILAEHIAQEHRNIKHMPAFTVGPRERTGTGRQILQGWLFFPLSLILDKNSQLWMDTK
jgi:hypothetical protein